MRKLIDIPEEIVKDLKKVAVDANKDLENFNKHWEDRTEIMDLMGY